MIKFADIMDQLIKRGPATNPLFKSFLMQVLKQVIIKRQMNGFRQEGFGPFDSQVPPWTPYVSI